MKHILLSSVLFASATLAIQASAQGSFAVTVGGGTTGAVIEGQYAVSDYLHLRGGYNYIAYEGEFASDDVDYNGELEFSGAGLFVDFHPFQNAFFVSGGAYLGKKEIALDVVPSANLTISGVTYTSDQYGSLNGKAEFADAAPFIGLGYNNTFTTDGAWGVQALLGAAFFDSGNVSLKATGGTLSTDPVIVQEVEEQRVELEKDIEDFQLYPIAQIGLSYRF